MLEHDERTRFVASNLSFGELLRRHGVDALLEEGLVQEREQHHPLPVVPLALEVHLEFGREERRERGVRRGHEPTERLGQERGALRGLHGEELLERAKRDAVIKRRREFPEPDAQIRRHGRVVEGIIPRPRRDTAVIVLKHPVESLEVRLAKLGEGRRLANLEPELLAIVHLLPPLDARAALLEHRAFRRAHHRRVRGDAFVGGVGQTFGFERVVGRIGAVFALGARRKRRHRRAKLFIRVEFRSRRLFAAASASVSVPVPAAESAPAARLARLAILVRLRVAASFGEHVRLHLAHHRENLLEARRVERPAAVVAAHVPAQGREKIAVGGEEFVQRPLGDVQRG